jgi:hypothetical protein
MKSKINHLQTKSKQSSQTTIPGKPDKKYQTKKTPRHYKRQEANPATVIASKAKQSGRTAPSGGVGKTKTSKKSFFFKQ